MPTDLQSILKIEVPVIVLIAEHSLTVNEVRTLAPGAILELPKTTEDDLEIHINNQPVGCGRAVKVGEHFGVRVSYVGNLRQRIKALSGDHATHDETKTAPDVDPSADSDPADDEDTDTLAEQMLAGQ